MIKVSFREDFKDGIYGKWLKIFPSNIYSTSLEHLLTLFESFRLLQIYIYKLPYTCRNVHKQMVVNVFSKHEIPSNIVFFFFFFANDVVYYVKNSDSVSRYMSDNIIIYRQRCVLNTRLRMLYCTDARKRQRLKNITSTCPPWVHPAGYISSPSTVKIFYCGIFLFLKLQCEKNNNKLEI